MSEPTSALPAVLAFVLAGIGVEWWLTRRRRRSAELMAANLWLGLFEQAMGLLVYVGLIGVYDQLVERSPLHLDAGSPLAWGLGVVGVDAAFYAYHRLSHGTGLGWALHAVHHQSPELNATAAVRNSPLGGAVQFLFHVPLALLGVPTVCWLLGKAVNTLWQLGLHTEAGGRSWLDGWINTPANHRVHHGLQAAYRDRNLGGVLMIWDRMFGTWRPETEPATPHYGTEPALRHADPFLAQVQPLAQLAAAVRQRGWSALWRPPADVGDDAPAAPFGEGSPLANAVAVAQLAAGVGLLVALSAGAVPVWLGVASLAAAGSLAAATSRGLTAALPLDILRLGLTLLVAGASP